MELLIFSKKASEVKKSAFDEAKANQLIEHFGGDPNRIVEAVGKTIGVKDLETFKKLSFEKIRPWRGTARATAGT